jgi:hypothetical protein
MATWKALLSQAQANFDPYSTRIFLDTPKTKSLPWSAVSAEPTAAGADQLREIGGPVPGVRIFDFSWIVDTAGLIFNGETVFQSKPISARRILRTEC